MTIDIGAMIAIIIALLTSLIVMFYTIAENISLARQVKLLKALLKVERQNR